MKSFLLVIFFPSQNLNLKSEILIKKFETKLSPESLEERFVSPRYSLRTGESGN